MRIVETNLRFSSALRVRRSTLRIVVHHTASGDVTSAEIHRWHLAAGKAGNGYQYIIRNSGSIERGRAERYIGAHARGVNSSTIGIVLTGNFEIAPPSATQIESLVWLIRDIWTRHGRIPVVGHRDVGSTACPGRHFPWNELNRRLRQQIHVVVSGDTLWELAQRYNVSVANIQRWNGLRTATLIRPGQRLIVS